MPPAWRYVSPQQPRLMMTVAPPSPALPEAVTPQRELAVRAATQPCRRVVGHSVVGDAAPERRMMLPLKLRADSPHIALPATDRTGVGVKQNVDREMPGVVVHACSCICWTSCCGDPSSARSGDSKHPLFRYFSAYSRGCQAFVKRHRNRKESQPLQATRFGEGAGVPAVAFG